MLSAAELRDRLTQAQNAIVALEAEKELYRSRWLGCVPQEDADRLKYQADKYGVTLMAIAMGCAGPDIAAKEILAKFGIRL